MTIYSKMAKKNPQKHSNPKMILLFCIHMTKMHIVTSFMWRRERSTLESHGIYANHPLRVRTLYPKF